jgi:hypothetical protein
MSWYNPLSWGQSDFQVNPEDARLRHGHGDRSLAHYAYISSQGRQGASAGPAAQTFATTGNAAHVDGSQQAAFRGQQLGLAGQLAQTAAGQGPSIAGEQLRQATDRNVSQLRAQAASQRGGGSALASRALMDTQASMGQEAGANAAIMRAQEAQNAQGQLGSLLAQGRSSDIDYAGQNAQLSQQMGLANMTAVNDANNANAQLRQQMSLADQAAQMQQRGMNDQYSMANLQAMTGMDQAELQAWIQAQQVNAGIAQQNTQTSGQILGGLTNGAGGAMAAAASDRRAKKDIEYSADDIDELMSKLRPYSYEYKDQRNGKGNRLGVMAQDVESGGPIGRALVSERADGVKQIDIVKGLGASLASVGRIDERLARLEGRKGGTH